jgi:hypothetical protein
MVRDFVNCIVVSVILPSTDSDRSILQQQNWVIANFVFQDYEQGLKFVKAILMAEPGNRQAQQLRDYIDKQMKKGS